jgi:hypothetical protein
MKCNETALSLIVTQRQRFQSTSKKYGIAFRSMGKLKKLEYNVGPTMRREATRLDTRTRAQR